MAAYLVARADVHDVEAYKVFLKPALAALGKTGGELLADGGNCEQLEGEGRSRNIIVRFPDMDAARAYFNDPELQAVIGSQRHGWTRDTVIVEGV